MVIRWWKDIKCGTYCCSYPIQKDDKVLLEGEEDDDDEDEGVEQDDDEEGDEGEEDEEGEEDDDDEGEEEEVEEEKTTTEWRTTIFTRVFKIYHELRWTRQMLKFHVSSKVTFFLLL